MSRVLNLEITFAFRGLVPWAINSLEWLRLWGITINSWYNEDVHKLVNSSPISFYFQLLLLPSSSQNVRVLKVIFVCPLANRMKKEIDVVFPFKNWFINQTTKFKTHFWRLVTQNHLCMTIFSWFQLITRKVKITDL